MVFSAFFFSGSVFWEKENKLHIFCKNNEEAPDKVYFYFPNGNLGNCTLLLRSLVLYCIHIMIHCFRYRLFVIVMYFMASQKKSVFVCVVF